MIAYVVNLIKLKLFFEHCPVNFSEKYCTFDSNKMQSF